MAEKQGCERQGQPHTPYTDEDDDVVCSTCRIVMRVGPLGINVVRSSWMALAREGVND